ncbi:3-hydroxyacyl-CoA dehydrogenase/enoyl-CoA hydratase family protein [Nitrococcus mobilis]|uniref:Putative 3-hydroxyacyl-CoA dehydrogenase oxidoreductase protein n=1 Tax=Nitrococcus mobilis Nb-231 TaxID=314278 RepID=A4BUX0_9GAMM|nr:3-hydroxyacyl-CoA dehydrogenase/enoyl-CoA hydratase family protein [Nitrococcus mobilis]EAR20484.1 putative 3-hydroxyacyl-CoA dehydrogenase oxidoreductase protein [Nitrococcus mobilis Nb-231]
MSEVIHVRCAAVLGAGVMGAQIAAHLVNAGVRAVLFELPAEGAEPNAHVQKAIERLRKLQPNPLATPEHAELIVPANYEENLEALRDCDLVIEAVAERIEIKRDLYARIAPYLTPQALVGSNTSGLSIDQLAEVLPEAIQERFCGIHFFNPPRYMRLVELTPSERTAPWVLDQLESFLTTTLGKGVIRARDTPNFIGNRIGVFALMAAMHHADRLDLPFDVVDALTGPAVGRPKSATFRTADVVGLDTLQHVVEGSTERLKDDPWVGCLKLPAWMGQLIESGALGQKTGAGVYRKVGKEIQVLDTERAEYRPARQEAAPELQEILSQADPATLLERLRRSDHPQAHFLWCIHRDTFHYAAYLLASIADNARAVDLAIRWGFGWQRGPFELWQAAGWRETAAAIQADIDAGEALAKVALPDWIHRIEAVHTAEGSYAPLDQVYRARSNLPVYQRQYFPDQVLGERPAACGGTMFETEAVRLWSLESGIAILSFKSRQHAIGGDVLDGVIEAVSIAERRCRALVLWQDSEPFSVGANLKQVVEALESEDYDGLERMLARFQQATACLREAPIPVVAGVRGMALGGGCEFLMHCDHVVAALESYIGLVETGVGLIPAGGGCKELALRAAQRAPDGDPFPFLRGYFETVAKANVAKSAREAQALGLLGSNSTVILHPDEVLHVAQQQAIALAEAGYRAPLKRPVRVAGRDGVATLKAFLVNLRSGGFISAYDYEVAARLATTLCGGEVDAGLSVSEDWLLHLEREGFMALLRNPKTRDRIVHTLKTGKPLRN